VSACHYPFFDVLIRVYGEKFESLKIACERFYGVPVSVAV
jgi:hypothetical protein